MSLEADSLMKHSDYSCCGNFTSRNATAAQAKPQRRRQLEIWFSGGRRRKEKAFESGKENGKKKSRPSEMKIAFWFNICVHIVISTIMNEPPTEYNSRDSVRP